MTNFAGCHHPVEAPIDADNWGALSLNSYLTYADLVDGSSTTLMVGEMLRAEDHLGWASGTRATLRNTGLQINRTPTGPLKHWSSSGQLRNLPQWQDLMSGQDDDAVANAEGDPLLSPFIVGGFGSDHTGGAQVLMADGAVRFVSENVTPGLWQRLGHRADGAMLDEF